MSIGWAQRLLDNAAAVRFPASTYLVNNRGFMHFHYFSFLLGLLFGIILLLCLIIYLLFKWSHQLLCPKEFVTWPSYLGMMVP